LRHNGRDAEDEMDQVEGVIGELRYQEGWSEACGGRGD
jgi:hypothetical protein